MNKKIIAAIVCVGVIGGGVFLYKNSKAPVGEVPSATVIGDTSAQQNAERGEVSMYAATNLKFGFVGYGPGKSHDGTFTSITASKIGYDEAVGLPVSGTLVIDAKTVSTGIEKLDMHLCSDDFFNCTAHPQITFTFASASKAADGSITVEGDLLFNGVTKRISFPVTVVGTKASADFLLDTTPFAFKYVGIDKNVRLTFSFDAVRE
jgi:polyisoprenoid-binding protein YceI